MIGYLGLLVLIVVAIIQVSGSLIVRPQWAACFKPGPVDVGEP